MTFQSPLSPLIHLKGRISVARLKSAQGFTPLYPSLQVCQPADARRVSQVPPAAVRRVRTTASTEAVAQSTWATSRRAAAPQSTKETSASIVSVMFSYVLPLYSQLNVEFLNFLSSLLSSATCEGFCHNSGTCLQTSNGTKLCLCSSKYIGHQCELDKCQFCGTGKCSTSPSNEVTCRYVFFFFKRQ